MNSPVILSREHTGALEQFLLSRRESSLILLANARVAGLAGPYDRVQQVVPDLALQERATAMNSRDILFSDPLWQGCFWNCGTAA